MPAVSGPKAHLQPASLKLRRKVGRGAHHYMVSHSNADFPCVEVRNSPLNVGR